MKNYSIVKTVILMSLDGFSVREIGSRTGAGHGTVSRIYKRWLESGYPREKLEEISEEELLSLIYPVRKRKPNRPLPDFEKIYSEVSSKNNKKDLYYFWEQYKKVHPDGYMYTQFCEHYRRYILRNHPGTLVSMNINRKPGEIVYIDWAGDTLDLVWDPEGSGRLLTAHFFVTTVGYSSMVFCEALPDEKTNSFCRGTADALHYYGALPKILKPDNTKAAVIRHTKDEIVLNSVFQDLEEYYGVHVVPAPPLKPKGKATVENAVNWIERKVMESLRGKTFSSWKELNAEILRLVDELNDRKKKGENRTRRQLFEEIDKPKMRLLDQPPFSTVETRVTVVPDHYHIKFKDHYYSVPFDAFRKTVVLRADESEVWITTESNRELARHRLAGKEDPKYITNPDHMPSSHRFNFEINNRNGSYYQSRAEKIGPCMKEMIRQILARGTCEEQNYRSCMGILQTAESHPKRAEKIAEECLKEKNVYSG